MKVRLTGMVEIPYWTEGEEPARPIDIWGIAGSVPNGFVTGAGCMTILEWVAEPLHENYGGQKNREI